MKVYAGQLGWLNSKPKDQNLCRLEKFKIYGISPETLIPQCCAEYLVIFFHQSGIYDSDMNGIKALTHQNLYYWMKVEELSLSLWEKRIILQMSEEYVKHYHKGNEIGLTDNPPYIAVNAEGINVYGIALSKEIDSSLG